MQPDAVAVASWMEQVTCCLELEWQYRHCAKRDIICSAAHLQGSCRSKLVQKDTRTDGQTDRAWQWQSICLPVAKLLLICSWEMRVCVMTRTHGVSDASRLRSALPLSDCLWIIGKWSSCNGQTDRWTDRQTDRRNGQTDKQTDGTDRQTDEWTDGQIHTSK